MGKIVKARSFSKNGHKQERGVWNDLDNSHREGNHGKKSRCTREQDWFHAANCGFELSSSVQWEILYSH